MTGSTGWPRIGRAAYCVTTQADEFRREENPQLDSYLRASPQAESAPGTSQGGDTGSNPVGTTLLTGSRSRRPQAGACSGWRSGSTGGAGSSIGGGSSLGSG